MYKNIFTSKKDLDEYRKAGEISAIILRQLLDNVQVDNTPFEINKQAAALCKQYKVTPSFFGVPGILGDFPANICVSVNDETLHTIPFSQRKFKNGDVVKLDFGIIYKGFYTDHCRTVGVGKISDENNALINASKLAVEAATLKAVEGNRVGDVSNALGTVSELTNTNYIEGYAGHGIGRTIHEDPLIPYDGIAGTGAVLQEGMVICIEIQLTYGSGELELQDDGWTLKTKDGSTTAMYEDVVLVGRKKADILTRI